MKPDLKPNDLHLVASRHTQWMKCFDHSGKEKWRIPCLLFGVGGDESNSGGNTPLGLYKLGLLTETQPSEPWRIKAAFGWYFIDMIELEGQEMKYGRAGVGIHGGGSGCVDPLEDDQELLPTHGCTRVKNRDMRDKVVPAYRFCKKNGGTVYYSVVP